jgi:hypothetical protein
MALKAHRRRIAGCGLVEDAIFLTGDLRLQRTGGKSAERKEPYNQRSSERLDEAGESHAD